MILMKKNRSKEERKYMTGEWRQNVSIFQMITLFEFSSVTILFFLYRDDNEVHNKDATDDDTDSIMWGGITTSLPFSDDKKYQDGTAINKPIKKRRMKREHTKYLKQPLFSLFHLIGWFVKGHQSVCKPEFIERDGITISFSFSSFFFFCFLFHFFIDRTNWNRNTAHKYNGDIPMINAGKTLMHIFGTQVIIHAYGHSHIHAGARGFSVMFMWSSAK